MKNCPIKKAIKSYLASSKRLNIDYNTRFLKKLDEKREKLLAKNGKAFNHLMDCLINLYYMIDRE